MKIFLLSLFIVISLAACNSNTADESSSVSSSTKNEMPDLLERKGELAKAAEWPKTKLKVSELRTKIAAEPVNVKPRLQLATIYIAEARITGEHPYYYPAIHKVLDGVLGIEQNNFDGLVLKSSVLMSQHRFKEALDLATKAKTINENEAYVYGILVDANVELGNYEAAIESSDKMQALKPSLESYSRASYLREIYGDYNGSIKAMELAVEAGLPGSEPQCWSMKTLGQLYINSGQTEKAEKIFRNILAIRPSYAFAIAGLAEVEEKKNNLDTALALLNQATALMPEFSFYEKMADIYQMKGENEKAQSTFTNVKKMLQEDEKSGHLVHLEMAKLLIKMNELEEAKQHLAKEYEARPKNIQINEELAWLAYKEKNIPESKKYLKVATRTGSKDPQLLSRAKTIFKS